MRRADREVKDTGELIDIIEMSRVCHVAMIDDGIPYIVPLSFGYEMAEDGLVLYFHSAKEGRKIDVLHKNSNVCVEISIQQKLVIDKKVPCRSGCGYASVIGNGKAEFLTDTEEKRHALSILMKHQSGMDLVFDEKQADSVCVFRIVVKKFSGKRKVV